MARLSAAAGAAVLRAARMRVPQEKFPSDLAIGVREMVGTGGGGLSGNGITKAVVDVSGPQARGEQAERRNQKTAVHTEKLIPVCGSQLESADGLGRRNEINYDKEVGRAVSQGASYESENLAFDSIPAELVQDRRSGKLRIYRLGVLDVVAVDPVSALLHRFAVHLGFDQSHRVVKFRGVVAVEHRGTAAVDPAVRNDTVDQLFIVGDNAALVDVLSEEP